MSCNNFDNKPTFLNQQILLKFFYVALLATPLSMLKFEEIKRFLETTRLYYSFSSSFLRFMIFL